jgi:hypothetical protein
MASSLITTEAQMKRQEVTEKDRRTSIGSRLTIASVVLQPEAPISSQ